MMAGVPGAMPPAQYAGMSAGQGGFLPPQVPGAPAPQGGRGGLPARLRGAKPRTLIAAIVVLVLVLAGVGAGAYRMLIQGGASSPDKVATKVNDAIKDKDLLGLLTMMSPAEREELTRVSDSAKKTLTAAAGDKTDSVVNTDALSDYLSHVDITDSTMTSHTTELSDNLARITITSWTFSGTVHSADLVKDVATRWEKARGGKMTSQEREALDSLTEEALDKGDATFSGDIIENVNHSQPVNVMAVKEGRRWYLSPAMSVAEMMYQDQADSMKAPNYSADYEHMEGGDSPTAAVDTFVKNVWHASSWNDLLSPQNLGLLPAAERRLAAVYGPSLTSEFGDWEPLSSMVSLDYTLEDNKVDGVKVVTATRLTFHPLDSDATWQYDKPISRFTSSDSKVTLDMTKYVTDPNALGIGMVKEDGSWRVSPADTIGVLASVEATDSAQSAVKTMLGEGTEAFGSLNEDERAMFSALSDAGPLVAVLALAQDLSAQTDGSY